MSEITITPALDVTAQIRELTRPVESVLSELFAAERRRWAVVDRRLAGFVEDLEAFVVGSGKRLRPALLSCGFTAGGGDPEDERMWRAAAAVELLHSFALLHDDVMDGADQRRGRPSYHEQARRRHVEMAWAGEPRRFGEGAAVLAGDLAFVYADQLMRGTSPDAAAVWDELRIEVTMGQHLDLLGGASGDRRTETAVLVAHYKTARYSVERPLQLGAVLADADPTVVQALRSYGRKLGLAFQHRDDLLGVFGDPAVTGKPVGDDLREGKPTLLLALGLQRATAEQRAVLERAGDPQLDEDDIAAGQSALVRTGAVDAVEGEIRRLHRDAVEALGSTELPPRSYGTLLALADLLSFRSR